MADLSVLATWLFGAMLAWQPVSRLKHEDPIAATERYRAIASDVARAVGTDKPLFSGPHGRAQTGLVLLSVALSESNYRREVDLGIVRGDDGLSCTLWQLKLGKLGKTADGFSCEDLVRERPRAALAGLRRARASFGACRGLDVLDRLSAYVHGTCVENDPSSRIRMERAMRFFDRHPPPR